MTEITFSRSAGRDAGAATARRGEGSLLADWWHSVDRWSLVAVVVLFVIGLVLGLAASPPLAAKNGLWTWHYMVRHVVFAVAALSVVAAVSMQAPRRIRRGGVLLFAGVLAATMLLPVLGTDFGKGATRWYSLGFMSLQPSEFLKPAFVVAMGWLISGAYERNGPPGRTLSGLVAMGIAAMLAMQPDFGQAALIVGVWIAMVFVSGTPILLIVGAAGLTAGAGILAYNTSGHFRGRIDGYLAETVDPNTQLAYAQSAIREGGLFGVGAAQGQVKWTLPDAHTDFIIAVAAEEFGLILTLVVVALYLTIVISSLLRLSAERQPFIRLAGTGLAVVIGLQAFVNLAVALRLLPAKGMTLPFISYGGSSMLAGAITVGALLALTRTRPQDAAAELRNGL